MGNDDFGFDDDLFRDFDDDENGDDFGGDDLGGDDLGDFDFDSLDDDLGGTGDFGDDFGFGDDDDIRFDDFDDTADAGGSNRTFIIIAAIFVIILLLGFGLIVALVLNQGPSDIELTTTAIVQANETTDALANQTLTQSALDAQATQTVMAFTDTPTPSLTPSNTPTPTEDAAAIAQMTETSVALNLEATQVYLTRDALLSDPNADPTLIYEATVESLAQTVIAPTLFAQQTQSAPQPPANPTQVIEQTLDAIAVQAQGTLVARQTRAAQLVSTIAAQDATQTTLLTQIAAGELDQNQLDTLTAEAATVQATATEALEQTVEAFTTSAYATSESVQTLVAATQQAQVPQPPGPGPIVRAQQTQLAATQAARIELIEGQSSNQRINSQRGDSIQQLPSPTIPAQIQATLDALRANAEATIAAEETVVAQTAQALLNMQRTQQAIATQAEEGVMGPEDVSVLTQVAATQQAQDLEAINQTVEAFSEEGRTTIAALETQVAADFGPTATQLVADTLEEALVFARATINALETQQAGGIVQATPTTMAVAQNGAPSLSSVQMTATALAILFGATPTPETGIVDGTTPVPGIPTVPGVPTPIGGLDELPDTGVFDDVIASGPGTVVLMAFGLLGVIIVSRRLRSSNKDK